MQEGLNTQKEDKDQSEEREEIHHEAEVMLRSER